MQQKTVDLKSLNATNGFSIGSSLVSSASTAGDINGDGLSDFIVGNYAANSCYVVFGTRVNFTPYFDVIALNGTNGFIVPGIVPGGQFGFSVATAGDMNGDGLSDIVLAAVAAYSSIGEVYVIFGSRDGFASSFNLTSLNGTNGFTIPGVLPSDSLGYSVATAGDMNGDGISDLVLGAYYANSGEGASYVIFGSRNRFEPSFDLTRLNGTNGFIVPGVAPNARLGTSVSTAGDINGDGFSDLMLGAPLASSNAGVTYIVFGTQRGFSPIFNLTSLNGSNGFTIPGLAGSNLGQSVSTVGDMNGDGLSEIVLTAYGVNSCYVIFGSREGFSSYFNLQNLTGTNGFAILGLVGADYQGRSVGTAGDFNADGLSDLVLGSPGANSSTGASYVIFGSLDGFASYFDLTSLNGTNGFTVQGLANNDVFASSVGLAGDVNGDGASDLLLGAFLKATIYVIFGSASYAPPLRFVKNQLTITQGQTVVLTLNDLNAFSFGRFGLPVFTVSSVQGGRFERIGQPGKSIFNFTQQQIVDGQVQFISDRSAKVAYAVSVNDGNLNVGPIAANITFTNYGPLVLNLPMNQTFTHDRPFSFNFVANQTFVDRDGDLMTFSAALVDGRSLPNWIQFDASQNNLLNFTGLAPFHNVATWPLSLWATDLLNTTTQANFTLSFVNNPPVVVKSPVNQVFKHDRPFAFSFLANETFTDPDGDSLTFSAAASDGTPLPNWIQFDASPNGTLKFTGTAPFHTVGTYKFSLFATDLLNTTETNFNITFLNTPPVVMNQALTQPNVIEVGKPFNFTLEANTIFSDPDDDALTFLATSSDGSSLPNSVHFNASVPNQLTFSGISSAVGSTRWRLFASDPLNETVYGDFSVVTVAEKVVNAGASISEIAGGVVGGLFGLGAFVGAGLGFWRYATNRSSRQDEPFANDIRDALNLKGVDNFKDHEQGKKYVAVVHGLIQALQESGIDPNGMDAGKLRELAHDVAAAARNKITPVTDCFGRSAITVDDLNNKTKEIVAEVQTLRSGAQERNYTF